MPIRVLYYRTSFVPIFSKNQFNFIAPTKAECVKISNFAKNMEELYLGSDAIYKKYEAEKKEVFFKLFPKIKADNAALLAIRARAESYFLSKIYSLKCVDSVPCSDDMLLIMALREKESADSYLEKAMELYLDQGNLFEWIIKRGMWKAHSSFQNAVQHYQGAIAYLGMQMDYCEAVDTLEEIEIDLRPK